jgi:superfamily I DNA/RNA helicase
MANPHDDLSLLRIANIPKRGLGPTALGRLSEHAKGTSQPLLSVFEQGGYVTGISEKAANEAKSLSGLVSRYRTLFTNCTDMGLVMRSLIDEIGYRDHICEIYKTPAAATSRLENIQGFIESLTRHRNSSGRPSLHTFLEDLALNDMLKEKEGRRENGVTLISFHSSKGLEFPVVFIVAAEEDILPHKKSVWTADGIEEERRLFYVGITRAMESLTITYCSQRTKYGKDAPAAPSRFIAEIPSETVKRVDRHEAASPEDEEKAARRFFANMKEMLGS